MSLITEIDRTDLYKNNLTTIKNMLGNYKKIAVMTNLPVNIGTGKHTKFSSSVCRFTSVLNFNPSKYLFVFTSSEDKGVIVLDSTINKNESNMVSSLYLHMYLKSVSNTQAIFAYKWIGEGSTTIKCDKVIAIE